MMYQKMEILKTGSVIDDETYEYGKRVIHWFEQQQHDLANEKIQTFITHLLMAVMRQKSQEVIAKMPSGMSSELQSQSTYNLATECVNSILKACPQSFSDSEIDYIELHMCNILNEEG